MIKRQAMRHQLLERALKVVLPVYELRNWPDAVKHRLGALNRSNEVTYTTRSGVSLCVSSQRSDIDMIVEIWVITAYQNCKGFVIQPGWVVLDLGANKGVFSVRAAMVDVTVRVIAYEPEPSNIRYLSHNAELNNLSNIEIHGKAVANASGYVTMRISDRPDAHWVLSPESALTASDSIEVPAITLNEILIDIGSDVDLVKMDIEGSELSVLSSVPDTAWSHIKRIVLECHRVEEQSSSAVSKEIVSILESRGYECEVFHDRHRLIFARAAGLL